jgi:hypothetical protein
MPTWQAQYVRLAGGESDLARVRAHVERVLPGAQIAHDKARPFAGWRVPNPPEAIEPQDLSELSRDFGEAVGIGVQSVADLVVYDRFVSGTRTRGLTYAGEAGWVRVAGEAEPWEAQVLFSQTKLEELRATLEEDLTGDALARDIAELERLWKIGHVEQGATRPAIEPLGFTRALEKHLALPALPRK